MSIDCMVILDQDSNKLVTRMSSFNLSLSDKTTKPVFLHKKHGNGPS